MSKSSLSNFNLRVYGLLIQQQAVLVSEEFFRGQDLVKFPGGGIEYGEGIIDALKREWQEEVGVSIEVDKLFYLTENFIQSDFCEKDQLISFYYIVQTNQPIQLTGTEHKLKWHPLSECQIQFTFKQDAKVFELLQASYI